MQRRIRFAGGSDGREILPRSSHSGSRLSRSNKSGMIKSALMAAALIATVYFVARSRRSSKDAGLASTGEGEGLEDIMLTHDQQDLQHNRHKYHTARERDHDHAQQLRQHQQHDTHVHQLHGAAIDADGSIVVQTPDKPAAAPPVLAPAHTVGGDPAHHAAGEAAAKHAAAHTGGGQEAAAAVQQPQAAHPAGPVTQQQATTVPATQQPAPVVQQGVPATQQAVPATQQPVPAVQQAVPAVQQPVPATQQPTPGTQQPAHATQQPAPQAQQPTPVAQQPSQPSQPPAISLHSEPEHKEPAVQPPLRVDAAADVDFLPDPVEEGAAAAAAPHQAHAHAARIDTHSPATGLYGLTALDIDGRERHFSEFAGKVTLVVNVASKCGFTDENYKGLQVAYSKYHKFGFEVLAFPSNEFGNQEPGTAADIKAFCADRFHTTFPLFSKVQVNGAGAHPVFQFLKRELPVSQGGGGGVAAGKDIGWNFYKFLVGRDGRPVKLLHQKWDQAVVEHAVYELLVDPQYVLHSGMHHG